MALTFEDILAANDKELVAVNVPQWGGEVYVRVLSSWEKETLAKSLFKNGEVNEKAIGIMRATWVATCLCDEDGKRIVPEHGVRKFAEKNSKIMEMLFDECQKVNAITKEAVDEAEKNSETTQ